MTGWRAGLVAGNAEIVERYRQLKTNLDSGMSEAVQHAAAVAAHRSSASSRGRSPRSTRGGATSLAKGLREIGLEVNAAARDAVLLGRGARGPHVGVVHRARCSSRRPSSSRPGIRYGPSGEGYVRLSLTVPDSRLEEAVDRITRALVIIQS